MHGIASTATPRSIVRWPSLRKRLDDVNHSTVYRWEQKGLFPRRIVIGPNCVGWYTDEIDAWFADRQRQIDAGRPSPNPKAHRATVEAETARA
jgi:predicted DNA-binding transcriptional regulator AlpA